MKQFIKKLSNLNGRYTQAEIFNDFLTLAANSLSNFHDSRFFDKREKESISILGKYSSEQQKVLSELLAMLMGKANQAIKNRYLIDMFNQLFMEGFSDGGKGQFFTPLSVSQFMANINVNNLLKHSIIKQSEMSCGSGGMIIALVNSLIKHNVDYQTQLLVECADVDLRCVKMCYIQLYLYGIPAKIMHRNELAMDTYEEFVTLNYALVKNAEIQQSRT